MYFHFTRNFQQVKNSNYNYLTHASSALELLQFSCRLFVFVRTEHILKTELFEKDEVTIIM